jgi:glutamine synthetase adenylyltransferase
MKLNQKLLKEMVREVLVETNGVGGEDAVKAATKVGSQSQSTAIKRGRERVQGQDKKEYTNQERNLVDQVQKFVSDLAAEPDVNLMRYRPLLTRVLKLLQKSIKPAGGAPPPPPTTGEPL